MHGHTAGLVQGEQVLILVYHGLCKALPPVIRRCRRGPASGSVQRGKTHRIPPLQALIGLNAALVDANFPFAHRAVEAGLGNRRALPKHEVVQALALAALVNGD